MRKRKFKLLSIGLLVLATTTFSVGFISYQSSNIYEINKNLDIFGQLFKVVNTLYVDETDPEQLIRTGIDAMLSSLDPYTTFISEEEAERVSFMSTGKYGGIGALVGKRGSRILIIEPYQGSPADLAGIEAGDQIIAVNNASTTGLEISDVRDLLRGEEGTMVGVTILRNGEKKLLQIRRNQIQIDNVPYYGMADNEVGYIQLIGFTENAGEDVRNALNMLKQLGELKGVILDLRDNPGGRLDEAVNVANVFLPQQQVIVETRGREESTRTLHIARRKPLDTQIPLVVLIDEESASASEIVAGAIQDLDRGIIVGNKSFGKGLVQNIHPLSYNTQLKITTAKYYTPSGRCIQSLDYSNRDKNGLVSKIPDSLQKTFTTLSGREVKDGGGIHPDITVEETIPTSILQTILDEGHIFDFATNYATQYDSISSPKDFHVDDQLFGEFQAFLENKDINFQTPIDKQLDDLKSSLQNESFYASLQDEIEELESIILAEKKESIMELKDDIAPLLEEEIAKRYYYAKGKIEVLFDDDQDILTAVDILKNEERYGQILTQEYKKSGK